ncbi:MAG: SIMPL domain-containing protein [bacterium]
MKKVLLIPLFIFLCSIHTVKAELPENPSVQFMITSEKEVESDVLIIKMKIDKKSGTFASASSDCNKALNKTKDELKKVGIDEKDIKVYNLNSYVSSGFFSKDYVVRGYVDLKIKDLKFINNIFELIRKIDPDISIENIEYDIENKEPAKKELIDMAAKKAKRQKEWYEESFEVKLELLSLDEIPGSENEIHTYLEKNTKGKYFSEPLEEYEDIKEMPLKKMSMNILVRYKIIK